MSGKENLYRTFMVAGYIMGSLMLMFTIISIISAAGGMSSPVFILIFLICTISAFGYSVYFQEKVREFEHQRQFEVEEEMKEKERQREDDKRVYGKDYVKHYDWPIANEGWSTPVENEQEEQIEIKERDEG